MTFYEQPPSKEKLKNLLNFDALDSAEKITGKSYKEDKATESLGMLLHMTGVAESRAALQASRDTWHGMPLNKYLEVVKEIGFEQVYKVDFHSHSSEKTETFFVFFSPGKGLLLCFDTYGTDHVNGGHVYFNLKRNSAEDWPNFGFSGGVAESDQNVLVGSVDCREGLRFNVEEMEKSGKLLPKWIERPHLWLLHHGDTHDKEYEFDRYDKIIEERINLLPESVRASITPKE